MRFEDEQYVKVYVRDTVTWKMLSYDARGLLLQLFRKLDRVGILDLKGHPVAKAIAAVVEGPVDRIEAVLPELLEGREPILALNDGYLISPRFLAGQSAQQSSTARSRAHRSKRRAEDRARALGLDEIIQPETTEESASKTTKPKRANREKPGEQTDLPEIQHSSDFGTVRPTSGRGVSHRDGASQKGTPRREEIRSDQMCVSRAVVNQPGDPSEGVSGRTQETDKAAPPPADVAQVFAWLTAAQIELRGRAETPVYCPATEGAVRHVLEQTSLPLESWREAIEGSVIDLRNKPPEKHRWLCLETLAKPPQFLRMRQVFLDHQADELAREERERIRMGAAEADARARMLAAAREDAEADALLDRLEPELGTA